MRESLTTGKQVYRAKWVALWGLWLLMPPGGALAAGLMLDRPSGYYESAFRVTISTPVAGAAIYYTTNGSTPAPTNGLLYRDNISVSTTTTLRVAAFDHEQTLTESTVRTYLFVPTILQQNGDQFPQEWGNNSGQSILAHYRMFVPDDPAQKRLVTAFKAIPALSVVTDPEHLFSPESGIYLHPLERGVAWERPIVLEMFDPQGNAGFQAQCGLRIHGGMSRHPEESPKHSFRVSFKRRYGEAKLCSPLFGATGAQEFDDLVLRAGGSDSWLESHGERRRHATYIRDEWMRRSMEAMGYPSARGRFVHLFLNGLYWGLYNLCEQPDAALSVDKTNSSVNYDVRKGNQIESGDAVVWNEMFVLANSGLSDAGRYQTIQQRLHLKEFADYMILNFYAGNTDWDRSANWVAIRPRIQDGKFQFLVWDGEHTLGDPKADTLDLDDDQSPLRLFHQLSENTAFRSLFAARVQQLLFNDGPLSPDAAAKRWQTLADSIATAMSAEAARWGNYRKEVHQYKSGPYEFYTSENHWQPQVNYLLSDYFPQRRAILLEQFRERGLFPAPVK